MSGNEDSIIDKLEKSPVNEWKPHVKIDAVFHKLLIDQIRRDDDEVDEPSCLEHSVDDDRLSGADKTTDDSE